MLSQKTALEDSSTGMSSTQAEQFAARYSSVLAVSQETAAGFSAAVFKDTSGNLTVAIRGTVPDYVDLNEDAYLTGFGTAYYQIKDMYNWWQQF
ncbi:MAG: hypothetical protein R3E63_02235 [Pseudomonadales bacterium]